MKKRITGHCQWK